MVKIFDTYCPTSFCMFHKTFLKVQTQSSNNKNCFCLEKPKTKNLRSTPLHDYVAKLIKKKGKKNKKKKLWRYKQEHIGEKKEQILITDQNTIDVVKKKKRSMTSLRSYISTTKKKSLC